MLRSLIVLVLCLGSFGVFSQTSTSTIGNKINAGGDSNVVQPVLLYPNPVKNVLFVKINSVKKGMHILQVSTMSGKVILQREAFIDKGLNYISFNTSKYEKGTYILLIMDGEETQTSRFIKE